MSAPAATGSASAAKHSIRASRSLIASPPFRTSIRKPPLPLWISACALDGMRPGRYPGHHDRLDVANGETSYPSTVGAVLPVFLLRLHDDLPGLLGRLHVAEQVHVLRRYGPLVHQHLEIDHPFPE